MIPSLGIVLLCLVGLSIADKEREADGAASRMNRHHGKSDDHDVDHQAVLGSRKQAEEFDTLPADESRRRLRVIAKKMDANGDGFIDETELTKWVEKSMVSLDEEEADDRMKEIDVNNDGLISWSEYVEDAFPDREISALDADDQKLLHEDEMYFKAADLNKDGFLNREELGAFLNPENHKHMHKTLVEVTLSEKDVNGDGAIDVNEFLGEMAENPQSEWHAVEKNRFMSEYDSDSDGFLRGEEVRKWLIPNTEAVAEQEASHLMKGADSNSDGRLSIVEVVDAYQLFVGSEATNYGEDLHKVSHEEL